MKISNLLKQNKSIVIYLFACLLACFFFYQFIDTYGSYVVFIAVLGIISVIAYYIYERLMVKKGRQPSVMIPIIIVGILVTQVLYVVVGEMIYCYFVSDNVQWVFSGIVLAGIVGIGFAIGVRYLRGRLNAEQTIAIAIFIAFLFHLIYAQYTGITNLARQNDTITFTNGGGHLGYIWHVWAYGTLPQVDPRKMWEFSQPPLYYLMCGYWVKISTLLGVPIMKAAENIQFFSVLCVTITTIYMDKIMMKMHLDATKRLWGVICFSLFPYFTYLAGAVNNDVLLLLLTVMAFYYAIRWYQEPKISLLIVDAVITGLLVMSKSSGALVAPAIATLFIMHFLKDKGCRGKRILQYLLFGVISLPIGLWWNVRNMVRFDMPFLYVNEPSIDSVQYIPEYSIWERFFGMENQLNHLYTELFNTSANVDYNIIITTFKTLVFTHSSEMMQTKLTYTFGLILFAFTIVLVLAMVIFGLIGVIKGRVELHQKVAWIVLFISYILFYLKFNFDYPFVHTMHVRYLLPVLVIGIPWMIVGLNQIWNQYLAKNTNAAKTLKIVFGSWIVVYYGILQCYIFQILIQAGEYM